MTIDVNKNRAASKWTRREQFGRLLWALASPLFHLTPRPLWAWRRSLLKMFGAKIGRDVHIYPSVRITIPWNLEIMDQSAIGDRAILYALGPISIGKRATISQGAHLCAGSHDISRNDRPLIKPPIQIGNDCWVCADAFVGPDVSIGNGAIVGARAVAMKNVPPNCIAIGNPIRVLAK